jgi:plasmid stabilization system protein ParE
MKKHQVQITAKALRDVDGVLHWFRDQHALAAAARWYSQLMARIDTLERQPARCRLAVEANELGVELRELLFGKRRGVYRILFVVDERTVNVLHIRHAARGAVSPHDLL